MSITHDDQSSDRSRSGETPRDRIWALHCPFTKTGYPNVGNFGSTVRPVIVIPVATWQKLCAEIPALGATQFEVGVVE